MLRPVTYHYDINKEQEILGRKDTANWQRKYDIEKIPFSGFIAQEVEAAAHKANYDFSGIDRNGRILGLRYAEFVVPLVKGMQEQQQQIEELNLKIRQFENLKMEMKKEIAGLRQLVLSGQK